MDNTTEIIERVEHRISKLGYPVSSIVRDIRTPSGKMVDLAVYEQDRCKIIFEAKIGLRLNKQSDALDLRFNPFVRTAQLLAKEMSAPYYVVSNETLDLWFTTSDLGRPQLLASPILPIIASGTEPKHWTKDALKRLLQELIYIGIKQPINLTTATEWTAIAIYLTRLLQHFSK